MKKKGAALAILMSLVMVFAMMPMMSMMPMMPITPGTAYADSEVVDAGVKYTLYYGREAIVSGYTDAIPDNVIIHDKIKFGDVDYPVTGIGRNAFRDCSSLVSIVIPESVTLIDQYAFNNCKSLKDITIHEGVTSIGVYSFANCQSLKAITIPKSVTSIEAYAFANCLNLETVAFAEGSRLETIGKSAFLGNFITGIVIPASITSIKTNAFLSCGLLDYVYYLGTEAQWNAIAKADEWAGGRENEIKKVFNIDAINVPEGKTFIYNGEEQTGVDPGTGYTLSGTVSAKAAGSHQAIATLEEGYIWIDATAASRTIDWKIDKAAAKVTASAGKTLTYNGQEQTGVESGEGYTLDGASATDAGTYTATATLKEDPNYVYGWSDGTADPKTITWKINKANNPLSIKGRNATVKSKKLKKKAQNLAVTKVIKFTKKGQGKLTYTKASGNKKITISKTTGKVTVKKGLKKGTYKVKVTVKAAGNANYNASAVKSVTFKIKVK